MNTVSPSTVFDFRSPPAPMVPSDADDAWSPGRSFSTQLSFAFERPAGRAAEAAVAAPSPATAGRIAGTYTVSYHASSGLLTLSGTLNVDGQTYFVDDQLMLDQAASHDGLVLGDRLVAWSTDAPAPSSPDLKLLAGLAVMAHLGLRPPQG